MKDTFLRITPDMFVSKPFIECPKCHQSKYGVLMINDRSYVRRCNNCLHSEAYKLPDIEKKVIYLDQMAISNMMNSIRPSTDEKVKLKMKPEWKVMFEKLDRLIKLQLIICPHSLVHEDESLVTSVFDDLKQMYEHLSGGTSFFDIETIMRYQLYVAFMKWLGKEVEETHLYDIVHGNINEWHDRLRISVSSNKDINYVEEVKKIRDMSATGLVGVFNRWKTETSKTFMDWYNEEVDAIGPAYWRAYMQSVMSSGLSGALGFALSDKSVLMVQLKNILRQNGVTDEKEIIYKLVEFFKSDEVKDIPYGKIYSMLCAVIADQAANQGRTQPPNQGTANDLSLISAFTPYCDALFIDNAFRDYVKKGDKVLKLGISGKFYSANNFNDFFKYLDEIEANASKSHIQKVKEVYGDDWVKPYVGMYDQQSKPSK